MRPDAGIKSSPIFLKSFPKIPATVMFFRIAQSGHYDERWGYLNEFVWHKLAQINYNSLGSYSFDTRTKIRQLFEI